MAVDGILDYVIGVNTGKAQGDAIGRVRENSLQAQLDMMEVSDALWKARYERERANRRGWKRHGMAASEVIAELAGVDKDVAEKMVSDHAEKNKARFDAENARVDVLLFHGKP